MWSIFENATMRPTFWVGSSATDELSPSVQKNHDVIYSYSLGWTPIQVELGQLCKLIFEGGTTSMNWWLNLIVRTFTLKWNFNCSTN